MRVSRVLTLAKKISISLYRDGVVTTISKVGRKLWDKGASRWRRTMRQALGEGRSTIKGGIDALAAFLGLMADHHYERAIALQRDEVLDRLEGCSPANAFPGEMIGYLTESAVRFARTIEWIADVVNQHPASGLRLLEIGSNPYFLTILMTESFPGIRVTGVNYFGDDNLVGSLQVQDVLDPLGRLRTASYYYADIERHTLDPLGSFDVCLFCEVIEHLVQDPAWALFNLASRLRVGGHIILTTPNPARLENISRLIFHSGSPGDPISGYGIHGRHNREYTLDELTSLLTGTGFKVLRSRTIDVAPGPWSKAAEVSGYGQYILIQGCLTRSATICRPNWLYRSFDPQRLHSELSLATN